MKKLITLFFALIATAIGSIGVYAQVFSVDGINYSITSSLDKTVRIEKTVFSGDLVIPATVIYNGESYKVTSIIAGAFDGSPMTKVSFELPSNLTSIVGNAFIRCKGIKQIIFPESVKEIGGGALAYCSSLETIVYGSNVESIGADIFTGLSSLEKVICLAQTPPAVDTWASSVPSSATLYVAEESIDQYKSASVWKNFKKILPISEIEVSDISLNKTTLDLAEGESETLVATVAPENATDKTVAWTSSDATVATVDANGKVTAVKAGTATITATCGNVSATCQITVTTHDSISDISIDDSDTLYYSINGVQVKTENLKPGIYIRIKGNKAEKIQIK